MWHWHVLSTRIRPQPQCILQSKETMYSHEETRSSCDSDFLLFCLFFSPFFFFMFAGHLHSRCSDLSIGKVKAIWSFFLFFATRSPAKDVLSALDSSYLKSLNFGCVFVTATHVLWGIRECLLLLQALLLKGHVTSHICSKLLRGPLLARSQEASV